MQESRPPVHPESSATCPVVPAIPEAPDPSSVTRPVTDEATASAPDPAPQEDTPPDKLIITPVGIEFLSDLTLEEWQELGSRLSATAQGYRWHIGDYLNYGRERFGKGVTAAFKFGRFARSTLNNFALVARQIELPFRVPELGWHHHRVIAPLPQEVHWLWLRNPSYTNMSVRELRAQIREWIEGNSPHVKRGLYGRRLTRKCIFTEVDYFLRREPRVEEYLGFVLSLPPQEIDAWEGHLRPFYQLWIRVVARQHDLRTGVDTLSIHTAAKGTSAVGPEGNSPQEAGLGENHEDGQNPPKSRNGYVTAACTPQTTVIDP